VNVLVDTTVWSLALRRRRRQDLNPVEFAIAQDLRKLIRQSRARTLGIVRQEVLSGIKTVQQFAALQQTLAEFPDEDILPGDPVDAAKMGNSCRSKGLAANPVDLLLCAVAVRPDCEIFTVHPDFERYSRVLAIRFHRARK